jgi:hypothetical protein
VRGAEPDRGGGEGIVVGQIRGADYIQECGCLFRGPGRRLSAGGERVRRGVGEGDGVGRRPRAVQPGGGGEFEDRAMPLPAMVSQDTR